MTSYPNAFAICLLALGVVGRAGDARAQTSAAEHPRIELWGGLSGLASGLTGTVTSAYSPPLLLDGDFTSHGAQALTVDAGVALGLTAGINVFPRGRIGFQILVDRSSADAAGANGPDSMSLQYVSRQPPDDRPQAVDVSRSTAWPDSSGTVTQLAVAFNVIGRIGPDRFNVTLSGGPALQRIAGNIQPVAYTAFQLGGHSVLFEDDYRLEASLGPAHRIGFDIGGDLNAGLGRRAAIVVGFRYFGGPAVNVPVVASAILNPTDLTFAQSLDDVAARLALAPMRTAMSGTRVIVGLKVIP